MLGSAKTMTEPIVLGSTEIERLPTVQLPDIGTGVSHRVLWEQDGAIGGLMRIRSGGSVASHAHSASYHDIWVTDGTCTVLGRHLGAGSYVHVPAGVEHAIVAGPTGCSFLYLYRRS